MSAAEAFLEALADRVAAKVLARLAGAASTSYYGTGRAATLPPGKSRAWALRNLKTIPGARKIGRDHVVSVADFDAWASERDTARCSRKRAKPANDTSSPALDDDAAIAAMVEGDVRAAGFRRTR